MRLLPPVLVAACLLPTSALLHADNPYDYRYGSAAYERAAAGRRSDERLNAPVTNSSGYTPDFSATISEIRKVLGPKRSEFDIVNERRRALEEARASEDDSWSPSRNYTPPAPPREPSYAEQIQTRARRGDPEAMRIWGRMEIYSGDPATRANGAQRLENAFNLGNAEAGRNLLGYYLDHPEQYPFRDVLYFMAVMSERGDESATRELAKAYLHGLPERKLAPDPAKARLFLERSFTQWKNPESGLELARTYRDAQATDQAIATYRQLIENQIKQATTAYHNCGPAAWEWIQLTKQADPDFERIDEKTLALWEYAAQHEELRTRAATHRVAAELGACFYEARGAIRQDIPKAILYLSLATSGDYRGTKNHDGDDVVLSNPEQARHLYAVAALLLDASPAWPKIYRDNLLVASTPADIARLYSRACYYAGLPDPENAANPYPEPFLSLFRLSYEKDYGFTLTDQQRLELLDRGLDLGVVPNDREHPQHLAYAAATYERARLIRALGHLMPDTQHRAALAFQTAWDYGYAAAALPLAELIDDGVLPPKNRADAKAICRLAAEDGDAFCAAQLGTWLTGEIVAQAKPDRALIAVARQFLEQARDADIVRATEDLAFLNVALCDDSAAVVAFKTVLDREPTPRSQAGFAELLAVGRGGLKADPAGAIALLEKANEEDPVYALRLAQLHFHGEWGLPKNSAKGVELLEFALMGRNEWHAGIQLARIYHQGLFGVPKDEAQAYEYLDRAGTCGNNETAGIIARGYETGELINANADSAAHWRNIEIHGLNLDPGD